MIGRRRWIKRGEKKLDPNEIFVFSIDLYKFKILNCVNNQTVFIFHLFSYSICNLKYNEENEKHIALNYSLLDF